MQKYDMKTASPWTVLVKKCIAKSWWIFSKPVSCWYLRKFTTSYHRFNARFRALYIIVRRNLNALHDARKKFIKAESSERIKRVLRHNVRTCCEENYQNGDKAFDKRRAVKVWRGPTKILEIGPAFYRCHPCHLMKAT